MRQPAAAGDQHDTGRQAPASHPCFQGGRLRICRIRKAYGQLTVHCTRARLYTGCTGTRRNGTARPGQGDDPTDGRRRTGEDEGKEGGGRRRGDRQGPGAGSAGRGGRRRAPKTRPGGDGEGNGRAQQCRAGQPRRGSPDPRSGRGRGPPGAHIPPGTRHRGQPVRARLAPSPAKGPQDGGAKAQHPPQREATPPQRSQPEPQPKRTPRTPSPAHPTTTPPQDQHTDRRDRRKGRPSPGTRQEKAN